MVNYCFIITNDCRYDLSLCNDVMAGGVITPVKIIRGIFVAATGLSRYGVGRLVGGRIRGQAVMRSRPSTAMVSPYNSCHGFESASMSGRSTIFSFWCICMVTSVLHQAVIISRSLSMAEEETLFVEGKVGSNSAYLISYCYVFYIFSLSVILGNSLFGYPITV